MRLFNNSFTSLSASCLFWTLFEILASFIRFRSFLNKGEGVSPNSLIRSSPVISGGSLLLGLKSEKTPGSSL